MPQDVSIECSDTTLLMLNKGKNPRVGEKCGLLYTEDRSWQYYRLDQDDVEKAVNRKISPLVNEILTLALKSIETRFVYWI
jgi:hypothetical protein